MKYNDSKRISSLHPSYQEILNITWISPHPTFPPPSSRQLRLSLYLPFILLPNATALPIPFPNTCDRPRSNNNIKYFLPFPSFSTTAETVFLPPLHPDTERNSIANLIPINIYDPPRSNENI